MSYNSFKNNGIINQGQVVNSAINTSSIDMDSGVITGHSEPVNSTDVVNKNFLDMRIGIVDIALSGTTPTTITYNGNPLLTGDLFISVFHTTTSLNGPTGKFALSKSISTLDGSISRLSMSPGLSNTTTISMTWTAGDSPAISKSSADYDGDYRIAIIANVMF